MFTPNAAVPLDAPRALCTDRLDLVDGSYARPGGEETQELRALCRACPLAENCLAFAMDHHEHGVWAATSPKARTLHGGPSWTTPGGRFSQ